MNRRFAAAGLVVALAASSPRGCSATGHGAGEGGTAGCQKLERLWDRAGGNPAAAEMAASIAMAESSGNRDATDWDSNGTVDRGYWQINSQHGPLSTYRAKANARAAVALSGDGTNWSRWTTYTNGSYEGRC